MYLYSRLVYYAYNVPEKYTTITLMFPGVSNDKSLPRDSEGAIGKEVQRIANYNSVIYLKDYNYNAF